MLILSRKANESIIIGDNIRVTVASVRGRYVRLAIEAPDEVGIFREELLLDMADDSSSATHGIGRRIQAKSAYRSVVAVGAGVEDDSVALDA